MSGVSLETKHLVVVNGLSPVTMVTGHRHGNAWVAAGTGWTHRQTGKDGQTPGGDGRY